MYPGGSRGGHGAAPAAVSTALPQYVVDKREKARAYADAANQSQYQVLETSMGRLKGFCSHLRHCSDIAEGAVLALGIPTTHALIISLNEVRDSIDDVHQAWREANATRKEEAKLQEEVVESMIACYAQLKDRADARERDLKHLLSERESKDAAMDAAIQYVHTVIAERTAWQNKQGYNNQELPMEDSLFSRQCTSALEAMYEVRRLERNLGEAAGDESVREDEKYTEIPIARPLVSAASDASALTKRWREIEDTRHAMMFPSARLRYIPPAAEVQLLRDVLAMGTGRTALVKDIIDQQSQLRQLKAAMVKECSRIRSSLYEVRRELHVLRDYLNDVMNRGLPFACLKDEFLRCINVEVEKEAMQIARLWGETLAVTKAQQQQSRPGRSSGTASPLDQSMSHREGSSTPALAHSTPVDEYDSKLQIQSTSVDILLNSSKDESQLQLGVETPSLSQSNPLVGTTAMAAVRHSKGTSPIPKATERSASI